MPIIEAEQAERHGAEAFAAIRFCSRYWQEHMYTDNQPLFTFMGPEGVVISAGITQVACNLVTAFQEKVEQEQFFAEFRDYV